MAKALKLNWPPEKTIKYEFKEDNELDFIIALEDNVQEKSGEEIR